jgi:predicted N-acyltransferase
MPDSAESLIIRSVARISEIDARDWDRCAGAENPFICHAFLRLLEECGCVGRRSGWLPQHAVLQTPAGTVLGVAPAYLKSHSLGEYVFDHAWADAYERAGGRYYPKLQVSVPFTPVPGPRLLVPKGPDQAVHKQALLAGLVRLAQRLDASSVHLTFASAEDTACIQRAGLLIREGLQFHWFNRGFGSFDEFLATLTSRKRKQIRRERETVRASGITVRPLLGSDMTGREWDAFFRFYTDTYDRKWGHPYLTREFFDRLGAEFGDRVVMIFAEDGGRPIAGALNLRGTDALYGRNWGAARELPFLHFEACYYQAIDFAIAHGLARVEAGTQGPHKLQRGYEPVATHSGHWFADARLAAAIEQYLRRERAAMAYERQVAAEHTPFRKP